MDSFCNLDGVSTNETWHVRGPSLPSLQRYANIWHFSDETGVKTLDIFGTSVQFSAQNKFRRKKTFGLSPPPALSNRNQIFNSIGFYPFTFSDKLKIRQFTWNVGGLTKAAHVSVEKWRWNWTELNSQSGKKIHIHVSR